MQESNIESNNRKKLRIAKEGWSFIIPLGIGTILFLILEFSLLAILMGIATGFVVLFFRDPERTTPEINGAVIAPADGRIVQITPVTIDTKEIEKSSNIQEKLIQVSIFLSIFDVHVNRSPISGKVQSKHYIPGKFLAAFKSRASVENERNVISIYNDRTKIIVKQIAGVIARRIVCWLKEGDEIKSGERIGLIKFGSRVDLLVPENIRLMVKLNEKVRAGETIVGVIE